MATSTDSNDDSKKPEDSKFECNICFESATDAVVSMCGHLFCWPCIHRWMETCPNNPACPVCKSAIDKERLIPLYGRGMGAQKDPRDTVPPRPQGQREEVPQNQGHYNPFDMGGINVSFGIGTFPFGLGPTFAFQTGQRGAGGSHGRRVQMQDEDQRRTMARFMLTLAILFIIMIIIS